MTTVHPLVLNRDVIARKKDYQTLAQDELLVFSTFLTIQGEGPFAGRKAFFIRLAGCNFGDKGDRCNFCDTKFSLAAGKPTTLSDLRWDVITAFGRGAQAGQRLVVVTGGEPCLQENLPAFCKSLQPIAHVQIETNGTQSSVARKCQENGACLVVSPKASVKTGGYAKLAPILDCGITVLKFVVTADESDPHHTIPDWAVEFGRKHSYARNPVLYVSPMTVYKRPVAEGEVVNAWDTTLVDHEATSKNYKHAAMLAMKYNATVSIQSHTLLALE